MPLGRILSETYSWIYNYGPNSVESSDTNLRYFRLHGYTKLAFLTTVDATGQDGERSFDRALAEPDNRELQVVAREHFNDSDPTVAAQIARIKASGAQALFTWGTGTPMGTVFRGIANAGLDIPVSMSAPNLINAEMKQYATILPKNLLVAGMAFMVPDALPRGPLKSAVMEFDSSIKSATGEPADIGSSIAWDPALVLVSALKKLGFDTTPQQIKDYIANLHGLAGANGIYDFRNGNNRGLGPGWAIMIKWDPANGTWVGASKFGGGS